MACYFCQKQGMNINDAGLCRECSRAVCVRPSLRPDKKYHGHVCKCGCRALVCQDDLQRHSSTHGSDAGSCFPAAVLTLGLPVLSRTLNVAADNGDFDDDRTFLRTAGPGAAAIQDSIRKLDAPERDYLRKNGLIRVQPKTGEDSEEFHFTPAFFDEARRGRIAVMAARAVGKAWKGIRGAPRVVNQRATLPSLESRLLDMLAEQIAQPVPRAVDYLEIDIDPEALTALHLTPGFEKKLKPILETVASQGATLDATASLLWLMFGRGERQLTTTC